MEAKGLFGGRVLKVDPNKLKLHPNADDPKVRFGSPGTLFGNTGQHAQLCISSEKELGSPEPTHVEVTLYKTTEATYLVMHPTHQKEGRDVYPLRYSLGSKAPVIRGLKDLFESNSVSVRKDLWYDMSTEIQTVEGMGLCVVANWTAAETSPRPQGGAADDDEETAEDAAAGEQDQ